MLDISVQFQKHQRSISEKNFRHQMDFDNQCPSSDVSVRFLDSSMQILLPMSDFGHRRWFWTPMSDFRHQCPTYGTSFRFWTLVSDFRRKRPILKSSVPFLDIRPVLATRALVSAFRSSVRLQTPMSHLRQKVYCILFRHQCSTVVPFSTLVKDFGEQYPILDTIPIFYISVLFQIMDTSVRF